MDTLEFLAQVSAQINADGKFISGKDAKAQGSTSTGESAAFAILDGQSDYTEEDSTLATEALTWIREYSGDDKFLTMLRAKVALDDMLFNGAAISAWVIPAFQRKDSSLEGDLSAYADAVFYGEVGKEAAFKGEVVAARMVNVRGFQKQVVNLADGKNHLFTYWPSKPNEKLTVGTKVYCIATVKGHKAFRGVNQTLIKRPKFTLA
jgi:hypothetical protein